MIFETKKIQLETLSEYLMEVRTEIGMSLSEVSEKTSIKPKFLEYLEQGEFQKLPADVYVFGFLRQLGSLYAIDAQVLIGQYKKERVIAQQLLKKPLFNASQTRRVLNKIVVTPKYVSLIFGLLFVVATLGYIVWQVGSINKTPTLEITSPQDRQIIKDSIVTVEGKTDTGMSVSINDQNVFVDDQGNFKTQIGLDNGPKQLVFIARNKFDKMSTQILTVIGQAPDKSSSTIAQINAVVLKLEFSDAVVLNFSIDNGTQQSLSFVAGDTKILNAQQKVVVSVSNAGATKVTYNGDSLGVMGKYGEKLDNIPFIAAPATPVTSTSSP